MLRHEIIEGVDQITEALRDSKIIEALGRYLKNRKDIGDVGFGLEAYRSYSIFAHNYNSAALKIHTIMRLDPLLDTVFLDQTIG
jgi:hypothetical protein